jgi:hypothetical protein
MYVLAGMLLGGLLCNLLIRPVGERHYMTDEQLAAERARAHEQTVLQRPAPVLAAAGNTALLVVAWTAIAIPLAWGVWITVSKSFALFR